MFSLALLSSCKQGFGLRVIIIRIHMAVKLYVGGLAWATTDESLEKAFSRFGKIESARVVSDRESGRSRGFGFVEFESNDDAQNAISEMNGTELDGRSITVNEARPMEEGGARKPRGNFGGGNRGGSGGYNRGGSGGNRSY